MELINQLVEAYTDDNWEDRYYLDIETGVVVKNLDESLFDEPESEWDENTNIDRFLQIPKATSSDTAHLMEQFAKQKDAEGLNGAIDGSLSIEEFEALLNQHGLMEEWTPFSFQYYQTQILDWLDVEELNYEELNEKYQSQRS